MLRREIIINGKLYTLISVLAREERVSASTMLRRIERGMPSRTVGGHVYVNREDCREFCGIKEKVEKPDRLNTLVIGGRVCHPFRWYQSRNAVRRYELANLPNTVVSGIRYIAEEDFKREYWWMEG